MSKWIRDTIVLCSVSTCSKLDCPNHAPARIKGQRFNFRDCLHNPDYKNQHNKKVKARHD